MTSLVIDIGNTLIKTAVFSGNKMLKAEHHDQISEDELAEVLSRFDIDKVIISSVRKSDEGWWSWLAQKIKVERFNSQYPTGISNHYKTPGTLGPDRLASVNGARHLYPKQNNIVIGGGTTITYDFIDADANYFGGSISPGLKMRYKALNQFTDGLPLVEVDESLTGYYGDDTRTAIASGVQNGIKYELTGFIQKYREIHGECNIILSGGDSILFDTLLKNSIFAPYIKIEPYLVLKGLNAAIQA